jgi:hypothetical protein
MGAAGPALRAETEWEHSGPLQFQLEWARVPLDGTEQRAVGDRRVFRGSHRKTYRSGFAGLTGKPTTSPPLTLPVPPVWQVQRVSDHEAKLIMSMGPVSYSHTHRFSAKEAQRFPAKIDTVLIEYPNSRHYTYLKLSPFNATAAAA